MQSKEPLTNTMVGVVVGLPPTALPLSSKSNLSIFSELNEQ